MRSNAQKPRSDIYETITTKLLAAIEASPGDPIMPWQRGGTQAVLPTNAITGQAYRGVNILSLWVSGLERGYDSGEWATLRQWNEKGARVRKGEKASPIVFYKEITVAAECRARRWGSGDRAATLRARLLGVRGRAGRGLPARHRAATQSDRTHRRSRGVLRGDRCESHRRRHAGLLPALHRRRAHARRGPLHRQ